MDGGQQVITRRAQARVGLLGNPSDGYNGCTISVAIANFWAEVTLTAVPGQQGVHFLRHPVHDVECWGSLGEVSQHLGRYGSFSSGIDLLKALCHVFHQHCHLHHIALPRRDGFSLAYDTNIPRQAGLSGSSAIVTAGLRCLMSWYELGPDTIPQVLQPNLVLAAEQALGITAGLQDRVAQVYGGVVFMDFTHLEQQGHGTYEHLDPACVPPLFLVWGDFPSHSGKVHANVRQRWLAGDQEVHQGMAQLADCARDGRQALEAGDWPRLANLMDTNFTIRRRLFSDQVVGKDNLHMVEVARSVGASAKLPGSGGAVIVLCSEGQAQEAALKSACEREGFQLVRIQVAPPNP